jgi:hypothetical protein
MHPATTDNRAPDATTHGTELIVAMIHRGDATLQTFLDLAALLESHPNEVLNACNRRPYEQWLALLEACPQPQLRLMIQELFFQHIQQIEGRNLRKALAILITRHAAERARYWQMQMQEAETQGVILEPDIVDYYTTKQRYAETQARYAHQEELIKRIDQLEAERQAKEERLTRLREDTNEAALQERIQQLEDEYRLWKERSDDFKIERDHIVERINRERRAIYKRWQTYIEPLEKSAERLARLKDFSGDLDSEQQQLVEERATLQHMFLEKTFRQRLKALYEEIEDMHFKLIKREYEERIIHVLHRWDSLYRNST